jgi:hypothetical protein
MKKDIDEENRKISCTHGLAESISLKWLHYQKQSICSMQSHQNSNDISHRGRKINPKVNMEAPKTLNSQGNTEQKAILEDSQ